LTAWGGTQQRIEWPRIQAYGSSWSTGDGRDAGTRTEYGTAIVVVVFVVVVAVADGVNTANADNYTC
jgi:hypothetical protein